MENSGLPKPAYQYSSFYGPAASLGAKSNILWETELLSVVTGCPYLITLKATEIVLFWIRDEWGF